MSRTVTYTAGAGTYWLIAHASPSATVPGWTRVQGTHYLWQVSASQPALPSRATWLLSATVSATAITAVVDRRSVGSPITGTFLGLGDTPETYSGQGLLFVRVRSDETGLEFSAAGGPGGAGDAITISGVQVDTTANFVNTGDIAFVRTPGGVGGPDAVSATVNPDAIGPNQLADTNFGGFTCNDGAGGCTFNTGTVSSATIVDGTIQQVDLSASSVSGTQLAPASVGVTHMTGDHGDVAYIAGVAQVQNVQCTDCISDAEVVNTLTASNYLPLAGGTLTGEVITSNLGLRYTPADANPPCTVGVYATFADLSENKFKKCENGVLSDLSAPGATGSGTLTTIEEQDNTVGTNIVSLDFLGADFDCSVSPPTEVNCAISAAIVRTTQLEAHRTDTLDVHGIADTSQLLLSSNLDTSLKLSNILTNETGTGLVVFGTNPTIATPNLTLEDGAAAPPTADGRLKYHRTLERLQVGDGTTTRDFVPVGTLTDALLCSWNGSTGRIDCVSTGGPGGAGTMTTIKENDVQIGSANIVALDFLGADFDCAITSPATEVNCAISTAITRNTGLTAAVEAHRTDATDVHGIVNTALLLTQANIGSTVQAFDADLANLAAAPGPTAAKIIFQPTGTIAATDVQAALVEVAAEAGGGGGLVANAVTASHMANADHGGATWSGNVVAIDQLRWGDAFPLTPALYDVFWLLTDSATGACEAGTGSDRSLCIWTGTDWEKAATERDTLQSVASRGAAITSATVTAPVVIGGATHAWQFYQDGAGVLKQRACLTDGTACTTFAKQLETASDWALLNESGSTCGSFDSVTMAWTGNYTGTCVPNLVVGAILNGGLQTLDFAPGRHVGLQNCAPGEVLRFRADSLGWECVPAPTGQVNVPAVDTYTMLGADCGKTLGNTDADALTITLIADPTNTGFGCVVCVFAKTAQAITIRPNGTDSLVSYGLPLLDASDGVQLEAAIGANVCFQGENTTTWWVLPGQGPLTRVPF